MLGWLTRHQASFSLCSLWQLRRLARGCGHARFNVFCPSFLCYAVLRVDPNKSLPPFRTSSETCPVNCSFRTFAVEISSLKLSHSCFQACTVHGT